jgi:Mg/Co/Ni transporter MgtE
MRKLLNQIIQWALRAGDSDRAVVARESVRSDTIPSFRIGVMKAMNGRILEVSTYKPNNHGPDWTNEMFIVPEDQTLTQALTTLLILKGLNT